MSDTPKSDAAIKAWPIFAEQLLSRLDAGKRTYGDSSFDRPMSRLIVEIQQELEDTANWSFILWARLEQMKQKIAALEALDSHEDTLP